MPLSLSLSAFSISLHLFLLIIVTVISNQKLQVSLPLARSVCLSDFIDRRPAVPFRQRVFHFHRSRLPRTLRAPSFATAVVLVWHRSARSNLINSCKFNYWLTASRSRALCIFFSLLHAQVYSSCLAFLFFSSPFSLSPCRTANKPISASAVFASLLRLQFLGETLWGTRLLVNGRMWDSTYMGIRGLNEFQLSSRVFSLANLTGEKQCVTVKLSVN